MNLSKKIKIIFSVIIVGSVFGFFGYNYAMQPPATIESKSVDFSGSAADFIVKIQENSTVWLDKVVVLEGNITSKDDNGMTLNSQIFCQFKDNKKIETTNKSIKIKGRFIGYDDLLEELKLDQCIIQD